MPGPLLVVDAPSLLYRAFFALPDSITGRDGMVVNALLGSVNLLLQHIEDHPPRAVVCCFGAEAAAYRTELLPAYHDDRPPMPDPLELQWREAPGLYDALGWHVTGHETLEADDLLGAYARLEEAAGGTCHVLTGDRDLFQAATAAVTVRYLRTGTRGSEEVTPAGVVERYGIEPSQVPDLIALRGDPSDGIPGAPGIGQKTAAKLLTAHSDLEGVIAAADEQTPRVRASLTEHADRLREYLRIATLQPVDVELPADRATDREGGAAAAESLGMRALAERLRARPA